MSFSSKIKTDLSKITFDSKCCQKAELSAIIRTCGSIHLRGNNNIDLVIRTENAAVARLVITLFKKNYQSNTELIIRKGSGIKKANVYNISVQKAQKILIDLSIINIENGFFINDFIPKKLVVKTCCKKAYVRGCFLGSGSVANPEKIYHLEFTLNSENFAQNFSDFLDQYELKSHVIKRKNSYVVYIKESEKIVDLLNVIGAHKALLDFENIRIIKQMRNDVNRIVNCETANLSKIVDASYNQIKSIELLKKYVGLENLPNGLKELAYLRIENTDMSLKELGEIMDPPLGKSGVNHRFKKIEKLADEFRNTKE